MSVDVQSAPATLRVLRGLQDAVSERRRVRLPKMAEEQRQATTLLADAALGLARSDRACSVLSSCLAQVSIRTADRFSEAAAVVTDRVAAVLENRVGRHEDPLFNPSVCLLAGEHDATDVRALSCALTFASSRRLPSCVVERFFEMEWVDLAEQDGRWVGVRLEIGQAGRFDFGYALAVVNLESNEVFWLDPDSSIV